MAALDCVTSYAHEDSTSGRVSYACTHPPIMEDIQVLGVPYVKGECDADGGDFNVMIQSEEYADTLFLFNGNVEMDLDPSPQHGSGSAVIRPWSRPDFARAASIPTGWMGGRAFTQFDGSVKMCIDMAFEKIVAIVREKNYTRIFFPCVSLEDRKSIGTSIFHDTIDPRVLVYVNNWIKHLHTRLQNPEVTPACVLNKVMSWTKSHIEAERRRPHTQPSSHPSTLSSSSSSLFNRSIRPRPYERPVATPPASRFGTITGIFPRSEVARDVSQRSISRLLAGVHAANSASRDWPPN